MPQNKKDAAAPKRTAKAQKPATPGAAAQSTAKRQRRPKAQEAVHQITPEVPQATAGTTVRPKRGRKNTSAALATPDALPTTPPVVEATVLEASDTLQASDTSVKDAPPKRAKSARGGRRAAVPAVLPQTPDPAMDSVAEAQAGAAVLAGPSTADAAAEDAAQVTPTPGKPARRGRSARPSGPTPVQQPEETPAEAPGPLPSEVTSAPQALAASVAEAAQVSVDTGVTVRPKPRRGRKSKNNDAAPAALSEPVELTPPASVPVAAEVPEPSMPVADVSASKPDEPEGPKAARGKRTKRSAATAEPAPPTRRGRKTKVSAQSEVSQESAPSLPSQADLPSALSDSSEVFDADAGMQDDFDQIFEAAPMLNEREARELLLDTFRKQDRPLHVRDLERLLSRRERESVGTRAEIEGLLERFVVTGDLVRTRKRTYGLPDAMNLVKGRFQSSASGFGFLIPEAGGDDYYVAPESTLEAWNGDIVLVRPEGRVRRGESPRATVVRVLQRAHTRLVGSLEYSKGYALLKSDDSRVKHRVLLMPEGTEGVPAGARVLAELYWPETTGEDEVFGRITKVLGETDDPETETQAVIVKFDLRDEFPPEVLQQAQAIPVRIPEEALAKRLDLRAHNIFTVDGKDAKDFDDAIHIEGAQGGNFVVGVHIADVSHYVQAGSPLDREAYLRATSVYLPGHVLPMLPEHLSNGVCSLVPNEDRLTLSAMIEVNAEGDVLNVELTPSVIRSQARLTYDEVQAYSEGVATLPEHARKVEGDLHLLLKLTSRMRQKRLREGSLDFKLREVKVDVDREGNLQLIPIREETARGMIEDLMLLANKVVARFMLERGAPALYRVHEEPTLGRFGEVSAALARMGVVLGEEPTPQAYQTALKKVRGTPQETVVNTLLLRSLKQARYTGENLGHFGLAFEEYLHFTSPIRRYPDLIVHRALRATLLGDTQGGEMNDLRAALPGMGEHASERERSAAEAERDLTKYYQAKWAQAHLGESFDGTVSGVTSFGLFVALENGVEGLLHISNLDDDYYFFLEDALMLKGRSSGRTYRMGDQVRITIAQVNPLGRQIDFSQETDMTDDGVKPRARKRGEREQERAADRAVRITERPPRLAALDEQQRKDNNPPASRGAGDARGRGDERRAGRPQPSDRLAPPRAQERGERGGKRRVVTLDRPRNEHNRPVAVTVQRMYFGDWSSENLRDDEPQGGTNPNGYRRPSSNRPQGAQGRGPAQGPRSAPSGQPSGQAQAGAQPATPASEGDRNRRRRRRRGRGNGKGGAE